MVHRNMELVGFTVFTAVYNGAKTIDRVYNSLLTQTRQDFEWLIIDDGSTDLLFDKVQEMILEDRLNIRFLQQKNMHKFYTLLKAIRLAKGTFFLIADADDEFEPDTLEKFHTTFEAVPSEIRSSLVGVNCLCKNGVNQIVGDRYPEDHMISDHNEMRYKYRVKGEKWGMQRTEILRKFEFPDTYINRGYIPENLLWSSIALAGYKIIFINDPLRMYHNEDSRISISTSARQNRKINSFGCMMDTQSELNTQLKYFRFDPLHFIKCTILYREACEIQSLSFWQQVINLKGPAVVLFLAVYPISIPVLWWRKQR